MVKYNDQSILLNDIVHFRIEFDAYPNFFENQFFFESELYLADFKKIGRPENKQPIHLDDPNRNKKDIYERCSSFKARLGNMESLSQGIHEYLPVLFDEKHFAVADCTLHAVLQDYKFRLTEVQLQMIGR